MAADIHFFTGLPNRLEFACRLVRQKYRQSERMAVLAPPAELFRLDLLLWSEGPQSFLPHLRWRAGAPVPQLLQRTPVWLAEAPDPQWACASLIHLGGVEPEALARHGRVAELVGHSDEERISGRRRWRAYEELGFKPVHHPWSGTVSA
ncbi:DNA polymerase III subunit chi [Ideonella livida]|uniref:DNA polymerase III subunit chi n=1 Tax=Ideonella livida TaxID=2707176 RepID=A0A7C9PIR1_9BURK|nr:DNA polymerase III subunit chi [Ideonella livida]NDY92172.1 DNA polymerase III subunit chi [Ideonella livida]